MLEEIKKKVWRENLNLVKYNLVVFTWGNVSEKSPDGKYMVIKPSGVEYDTMQPEDMVVVDISTGDKVEGKLKPSSDTDTHLEIYRNFAGVGGVVHTHSKWATTMAQMKHGIPALGTTHGDYFYGEIPCTRLMTPEEIAGSYELETGKVIVETFKGKSPVDIPGVLVASHGPFSWGTDSANAVHNSVVMEYCAEMAYHCMIYNPDFIPMQQELLDKHYLRKHGANAYYGQ